MPASGPLAAAEPDVRLEGAWMLPAGQVAGALGVDPAAGLPDQEAAGRLDRFGRNELLERAAKPA